MGRKANTDLRTAATRKRLKPRTKPYFVTLEPRKLLGYVRAAMGAGRWIVQVEVGRNVTGSALHRSAGLGLADDIARADGFNVLSYAQAMSAAAAWAPGGAGKGITVARGAEIYLAWLGDEKGERAADDAGRRIALHVLPRFGTRAVASLNAAELEQWKGALLSRMKKVSANRTVAALRAALNYLYERPEYGIDNDHAWRRGLKAFRGVAVKRVHHFGEDQLAELLKAAYAIDPAAGAYFEAIYHLGARPPSEVANLRVRDYSAAERQVHIRGGKTGPRFTIVGAQAAQFFERLAKDRADDDLLLLRSDGSAWNASAQRIAFQEALKRAKLSPRATPYSLRHSHISRAIERGQPLTVIARNVGSSAVMLERFYAHIIANVQRDIVERTAPRLRLRRVK